MIVERIRYVDRTPLPLRRGERVRTLRSRYAISQGEHVEDTARIEQLRPMAKVMAKQLGKPIRVVLFSGPPEVIETIEPGR